MNKKILFFIILAVDIVLGIIFVFKLAAASEELTDTYVDKGELTSSSLLMYLERENYGTVAVLARPYRVGGAVNEADEDLYRLGEYAELLFTEKINEEAGRPELVQSSVKRREALRDSLGTYKAVLDKMEQSTE
ncbi:MAG: hypothetical protein K5686_07175 [Lachnospiraceae bacterium]|nr:hypothetical protein [Lachnospiraceae bacterium]